MNTNARANVVTSVRKHILFFLYGWGYSTPALLASACGVSLTEATPFIKELVEKSLITRIPLDDKADIGCYRWTKDFTGNRIRVAATLFRLTPLGAEAAAHFSGIRLPFTRPKSQREDRIKATLAEQDFVINHCLDTGIPLSNCHGLDGRVGPCLSLPPNIVLKWDNRVIGFKFLHHGQSERKDRIERCLSDTISGMLEDQYSEMTYVGFDEGVLGLYESLFSKLDTLGRFNLVQKSYVRSDKHIAISDAHRSSVAFVVANSLIECA